MKVWNLKPYPTFFQFLTLALSRQVMPCFGKQQLWAFTAWIQVLPKAPDKKEQGGPSPTFLWGRQVLTPVTDLPGAPPPLGILSLAQRLQFFVLTLTAVFPASVLGCSTLQSSFRLNMLLFPAFWGLGLTFSSDSRSFKKNVFSDIFGYLGQEERGMNMLSLLLWFNLCYFFFLKGSKDYF